MSDHEWHTDAYPELRSRPPWVMQEMIAAQPALVQTMLSEPVPEISRAGDAIASALTHNRPVIFCGCGTSEHAAHAVVALLSSVIGPEQAALVRAVPALSAATEPASGVCVAISHDGETRASTLALLAARSHGARTVAITHQPESSVARAADHVMSTPRHDDSWCHTVAFTSALAAGASLAARFGAQPAHPAAARELLARAISLDGAPVASALADRRVLLCAGPGTDHITARELALKIAEGARLPAQPLELETVLHGQLAAHEPADGLIVVAVTEGPDLERIARRTADVARAANGIGLGVAGLFSAVYDGGLGPELTPAGRLVLGLPDPSRIEPRFAGLLAGAGLLQTLTLALAHARHTNPDLIRREQAPYRQAAQEAEGAGDW